MISVQVAVDDADRGNGGLQVIRGSHKMGRIDHGRIGEQAGADMERVEQVGAIVPPSASITHFSELILKLCLHYFK